MDVALPSSSSSRSRGSRIRLNVQRLAVSLLVAACLIGLFWGLSQARNELSSIPTTIESLSPVPGAQTVPAQSSITAVLHFGQVGALIIDGNEIPDDQLTFVRATGTLTFTPGPGRDLERLPGGVRRATVVYWPAIGSREANGREYTWSFTVN